MHGAHEYQLTSEVPGTPCHQLDEGSWEDAVRVMAETLRRIHMLDADGCPITRTASMRIGHLRKSGDSSTLVRLKELEATAPDESPVFTHGDYCLPNIILSGGSLSGVIDWDYAGLADPYTDLEACIWSIKHNYGAAGEELVPFFLWAYGLEEPDMEKLDWYDRLSELE